MASVIDTYTFDILKTKDINLYNFIQKLDSFNEYHKTKLTNAIINAINTDLLKKEATANEEAAKAAAAKLEAAKAAEKLEAAKQAAEKQAAEKQAKEAAEAEKQAKEAAEAEKLEAEKLQAAIKTAIETSIIEAAKAAAKLEAAKAAEKLEAAKAAEKLEAAKAAENLEAAKAAENLEAAKAAEKLQAAIKTAIEASIIEAAKLKADEEAAAKLKADEEAAAIKEAVKLETERLDAVKLETERLETERQADEEARQINIKNQLSSLLNEQIKGLPSPPIQINSKLPVPPEPPKPDNSDLNNAIIKAITENLKEIQKPSKPETPDNNELNNAIIKAIQESLNVRQKPGPPGPPGPSGPPGSAASGFGQEITSENASETYNDNSESNVQIARYIPGTNTCTVTKIGVNGAVVNVPCWDKSVDTKIFGIKSKEYSAAKTALENMKTSLKKIQKYQSENNIPEINNEYMLLSGEQIHITRFYDKANKDYETINKSPQISDPDIKTAIIKSINAALTNASVKTDTKQKKKEKEIKMAVDEATNLNKESNEILGQATAIKKSFEIQQ